MTEEEALEQLAKRDYSLESVFSQTANGGYYDFTVCERPDGSKYGTGGQCRKGKETSATEKEKSDKPKGLVERAKSAVKSAVRKVTGAEAREKKAEEKKAEEAKVAERKERGAKMRANTDDMVNRIKNDLPAGAEAKNVNGTLSISMKTKAGHSLDYSMSRTGNVEFSVNGTWDAGTVKDRREQLEVAMSVRRMHEAVVKNLRPGHEVWTEAWAEDGKGDARIKAYKAMGFSQATGEDNLMVARRNQSGKLEPVEGENSADRFMMRDQDFMEESEKEEVKLWYQVIFGVEPGGNQ